MRSSKQILSVAASVLLFVMAAGCAALFPPPSRDALAERVKQYMQAQMDEKWDHTYAFFDAATREKTPREQYVARTRKGKVSFSGFEIEEITVLPSGTEATVKVRIDISVMGFNFKRAPQTQKWVVENGEWFVNSEPQKGTPFGERKPLPGKEK